MFIPNDSCKGKVKQYKNIVLAVLFLIFKQLTHVIILDSQTTTWVGNGHGCNENIFSNLLPFKKILECYKNVHSYRKNCIYFKASATLLKINIVACVFQRF